ncbi:MAG: type II toxin-antitoxin system ParD family antitoxin [Cyanobacteria bacterium P01_C01_bin.72]
MNIALTPEQQNLIQAKLKTGKYQSSQQIIEIALRLFDEYEQAESEWSQQVRTKIQAAIDASEHTAPVDGETFINGILKRFSGE